MAVTSQASIVFMANIVFRIGIKKKFIKRHNATLSEFCIKYNDLAATFSRSYAVRSSVNDPQG